MSNDVWPSLPYEEWNDTLATLQLWLQIAGKIRLAQAPMVNHWWQVTLYVTSRGLGTSAIPYGDRAFQLDFDFIDHILWVSECNGRKASVALEAMPVAEFYRDVMSALEAIDVRVPIRTMPSEIAGAIPFDMDFSHASYDRAYVHRFWRALLQADRLFKVFRSRYIGKVSPVHFFWGAPDLAVTRFSGRTAPPHPGGIPNMPDWVTREAYSHEVSSAGWWPGAAGFEPLFYSYAYPEPNGFSAAPVPAGAFYHDVLREFALPYETVRRSGDPDGLVLAFLQRTYEAAADAAHWERTSLER